MQKILPASSLVAQAMREVTTYSVDAVRERMAHADSTGSAARMQLVDIRDVRELDAGLLPGAFHAPRGMLEFWVDPASPYHKPVFANEATEFVLYCGAGWRSAMAAKTLQDMGLRNVAHIDGGFAAWQEAGAPLETLAERKAKKAAVEAAAVAAIAVAKP